MPRLNIDFTDVGDGFSIPPEGDYVCKVKSITLEEGNKGKYLKWTLVIGTGPEKGSQVFHNTTLVPAGLFNLRNTIIACGFDVPKSVVQINTDNYIGKIVGITVRHREYERDGEKRKAAQVADIYRVVKTDRGFVRADQKEKEEVIDALTSEADVVDLDDDADEIDI